MGSARAGMGGRIISADNCFKIPVPQVVKAGTDSAFSQPIPMHSPKIVIIGAGSLFFGRKLVWSMNCLEGLTAGHLALVDTDPEHLRLMDSLAKNSRSASGASFEISATTQYRDALEGADFVILSFSHRNAHFRGIDCEVSARHGIRMCSGDTIGPGGIFRAFRELPKIQEIAAAVEEICPKAWLVNYINPSAVIGTFLQRHTRTKNLALCDSLHLPHLHESYMKLIGLDPADRAHFSMKIAGVNHFTFCLEARYRGHDVMPRIHAALKHQGEKENPGAPSKELFNKRIAARLHEVFGALPVCTGHTKEYVPYFQGLGPHGSDEIVPPLNLFDVPEREKITRAMWSDLQDYDVGRKPIRDFLETTGSDHATDLIQAIWNGSGRHLFVNVPNGGSVSNLPPDAILELECVCGADGPEPLPVGAMPLGLRSQQMRILDTHELTVEAWVRQDRGLLVRALAVDPIVNSLAAAEAVIDDLYNEEKECLPPWVAERPPSEPVPLTFAMADTVHQGQTTI
ncbi:MAG: alpha-galactosidase [Terrimicrobiaceae bacterium]